MPEVKAVLTRFPSPHKSHPTFGVLSLSGIIRFVTLELPWRSNQRDISCIPLGVYTCKKALGVKLRLGAVVSETFEVDRVPGRDGIYFHSGNTERNTLGCIIIGSNYGITGGLPSVIESRRAFSKFLAALDKVDEFNLIIENAV